MAIGGEGEVSIGEGIDEIWALERCLWFLGRVLFVYERAAREEADGLRYCGLEETTVLRVR